MPDTSATPFPRNSPDLPATPLQAGESKQAWVYRQITHAIAQRWLQVGQPVPSTRALAARWGVSRGTVELAFERLAHEGYLQATIGQGTRVCDALPEQFLPALSPLPPAGPKHAAPVPAPDQAPSAGPPGSSAGVRAGLPFVARLMDIGSFDLKAWRHCVARAAQALTPDMLDAPDPRGLLSLRQEICRHVALSRGVHCTPDQVLVVTGIRHAIDVCAQAMAGSGTRVALEDPGYRGAAEIFALRGCQTLAIAVDEHGMDVAALQRSQACMAYVTPAHQAPTGVVLSPARRTALLQWAQERGTWIVEDDYDSDFSYEAAPLPALKSQDTAGHVLFCGSFNKSVFPALRIGFVVAPLAAMPALLAVRGTTGRANAVLDQLALVEFMRSGAFGRHLKRARLRHQLRRDLVLAQLYAAGWPGSSGASVQGLHAGFHFVLRLPPQLDEDSVIERAAQAGVVLQGLRSFWRGGTPPPPPAVIVGYAALSDAQARWHGRLLAGVLQAL